MFLINTLLNIYYAIFNSHLIYGCQIWGQKLPFYLNKLIKTQDKVLRIIHHKTRTEPVNPLYKSANVMKLQDYITILNCLFAYDHNKKKFQQHLMISLHKLTRFMITPHVHLTKIIFLCHNAIHLDMAHILSKHNQFLIWNSLQKKLKINIESESRTQLNIILTDFFLKSYT